MRSLSLAQGSGLFLYMDKLSQTLKVLDEELIQGTIIPWPCFSNGSLHSYITTFMFSFSTQRYRS